MFGIDGIITFLFNLYWDIRDAKDGKRDVPINSNVITLYCLASDDIPMDTVNSYCKSLEILYACMIRSILTTADRSRFNSQPKDIFQSIPILNAYDRVKMKKNTDMISRIGEWFCSSEVSAKQAIDTFTENYHIRMEELYNKAIFVTESGDVILKEARGAVPTFINIGINVYQLNGRPTAKNIAVGVEVRPKLVPNHELVSMLIKRTMPKPEAKALGFMSKVRNLFRFNSKRPELTKAPADVKKDINTLMGSVAHIDKPFVCLLLSSVAKDMLEEGRISITNSAVAQGIYKNMPIMSITVYDSNTDLLYTSLTRDSYFTTRTAAEFSSEISNLEKQLAEVVRVNRTYGM